MELRTPQVLTDRMAARHTTHQEPCVATALASPVARVANIDRLRIVAAIGIVWFHTEGAPYRGIGYAGLPIFLLIFFSLITSHGHRGGTAQFVKRRWHRLMVPWLFWSVVYGLCKIAKATCTMDINSLRDMLSVESLLTGTHIHLWYLPYAFAAGLLIYMVNGWTWGTNNIAVIVAAAVLGAFTLMAHATGVLGDHLMMPLAQWGFGLAAVPLGFAIGRCMTIPSHDVQRSLLCVIALVMLVMCTVLNMTGYAALSVPYELATVLVCAAYAWPSGGNAFVATVAPLTFGIYLIHPLVGYGLKQFIAADQHYLAFIVLTVCMSGVVTLGLTKTPLKRFV